MDGPSCKQGLLGSQGLGFSKRGGKAADQGCPSPISLGTCESDQKIQPSAVTNLKALGRGKDLLVCKGFNGINCMLTSFEHATESAWIPHRARTSWKPCPAGKEGAQREAVLRILPVLAAMSSGWEEYHQQMTFLPEHVCRAVGHTQQSAELVPCGLSCSSIFAAFGLSLGSACIP